MSFPVVINSLLGSISHHFWNTVTYWLKIAVFRTLFSALNRPVEFREKLYGSWK